MDDYAKMCKEAEEIQNIWVPKVGDKVIEPDKNFPKWVIGTYNDEAINISNGVVSSNPHYKEGLIWLPTQEDLQKIFMDCVECQIQCATLEAFNDWLFRHDCVQKLGSLRKGDKTVVTSYNESKHEFPFSIMSLNVLWLAFVMEDRFKKVWEETKWVNMVQEI